jgi:type IX secretion system PorP/SprF family membrane protein
MKMLPLILIFVVPIISCTAQQDPLYSQYMLNPLSINPAYAGLNNQLNFNAGFRTQWTGFDGNPTTLYASVHSSLVDNKVGAGVLFTNDKIGSVSNTEVNAAFSYRLDLNEKILSFGMQAGFQSFQTNYESLTIYHPTDPAFSGNDQSTRINLGAGMILKSERYFVGLSVPRLLPSTFKNGGQEFQLYNQHYYLAASYVFYLNENIRFKPSALIRGVKGAPVSADVAMNININAIHTVGVFARNLNAYGLLLQTTIKERLRLGYVFELPTNHSVGQRFTSHEIGLMYSLPAFGYHDRNVFSNF